MMRRKVMAIGIDGFDLTLANRFMAEGQMPALSAAERTGCPFCPR